MRQPFIDDPEVALRVDRLCDEFADAEKSGGAPRIEDFLLKAPVSDHHDLLRELIALELESHEESARPRNAEEYYSRFPELVEAVDEAFAILEDAPNQGATSEWSRASTLRVANDALTKPQDASLRALEFETHLEIGKELGRGAFGTVFEAFDTRLERKVAVKVAHGPVQQSARAATYLREARHVANLSHPHIASVFEIIEREDLCAIVFQFIDGDSLHTLMQRDSIPLTQAAQIVCETALALHHAHAHDIYHRDVKPSNVLVDRNGGVFLVDFGLAVEEQLLATERNKVAGTLHYMSPEQVRGDAHLIDGRTDVYSLGVILYELCCGKLPFSGGSSDEVMEQILYREPRPPRQVDSSVPAELERISLKALSKNACDRYSTAEDMATDLSRWVRGQRPKSVPRGWLIALIALFVVGAAVVGSFLRDDPSKPPRPVIPIATDASWFHDGPLKLRVWVWQGAEHDRAMVALRDALPLRSARDGVRIELELEGDLKPGLFWFDTEGNWHELPLDAQAIEDGRRTYVWPSADQSQDIEGAAGTELILVCRRGAARRPQLDELVQALGPCQPWPKLSGSELIFFDRARTQHEWPRGPGGDRRNRLVAESEARRFRQTLARDGNYLIGIAVGNAGSPPGPE